MFTIFNQCKQVITMTTSVIARVPDDIARDIDFFARAEQVDRSTEIRRLLAQATQQKKIEYALSQYQTRKVTLWKAAKIADLPLTEMMSLAAQHKIPIAYDAQDLQEDFKAVFGQ